jgi:hypoxanthine phosphoribosyltransferase
MTANVLLDAPAIEQQVRRLGREIAADHPDGVLLVGVLMGALIFLADLVRAIPDIAVEVEFMSISRFAPGSGRVRILHDLGCDIGGRDVVVVEDIVDTGLTLAYLTGQLAAQGPRRLHTCTLLDRPVRRIVPHELRYQRGFELGDDRVGIRPACP